MDIRLTTLEDTHLIAAYYQRNQDHFKNWEPLRAPGYFLEHEIQERQARCLQQQGDGSAAYFIALEDDGKTVIAHCSLTNIIYGAFRAGFMGYGVDKDYEGKGVMPKVCKVAIDYGFQTLQLNRIMANHMPSNTRSERVLEKLGFIREGYAKNYLKINGRWEDHVLTSLVNPVSE